MTDHPTPVRGEIRACWLECDGCGGDVEIEARMVYDARSTTTYRCDDCGGVGVQRVHPDESNRRCRVETEVDGVDTRPDAYRMSSRENPFIHRRGVDITR